jgi:hypothetical protein
MKSTLSQDKGIDLGEATIATIPVAVLRMEPDELTSKGVLSFREGFDDLDYLVFAMLSLPSGREVTLVRHTNAPSPGTEVCVVPEETAIVLTIIETIKTLNIAVTDLSWIHPDCANVPMDISQDQLEQVIALYKQSSARDVTVDPEMKHQIKTQLQTQDNLVPASKTPNQP